MGVYVGERKKASFLMSSLATFPGIMQVSTHGCVRGSKCRL